MEEMLPNCDIDEICTETFATELLELIFNKFNVQTLFTMSQFTSEIWKQEHFTKKTPTAILGEDHELYTGRVDEGRLMKRVSPKNTETPLIDIGGLGEEDNKSSEKLDAEDGIDDDEGSFEDQAKETREGFFK